MRAFLAGLIGAVSMLAPLTVRAEPAAYEGNASGQDCIVHTILDRATGEDITRATRCALRYIKGVNVATGAKWNADIYSGGEIKGVDINGDHFRYDPRTKLWTNLATGKTCAQSTPRHVCAG